MQTCDVVLNLRDQSSHFRGRFPDLCHHILHRLVFAPQLRMAHSEQILARPGRQQSFTIRHLLEGTIIACQPPSLSTKAREQTHLLHQDNAYLRESDERMSTGLQGEAGLRKPARPSFTCRFDSLHIGHIEQKDAELHICPQIPAW